MTPVSFEGVLEDVLRAAPRQYEAMVAALRKERDAAIGRMVGANTDRDTAVAQGAVRAVSILLDRAESVRSRIRA